MGKNQKAKRTAKQIAESKIKRGASNAEALEAVLRAHPHSEMTLPTINYYRNQLRKLDKKIKPARQAGR